MKNLFLSMSGHRNCEGVSRRDLLRVGALSYFGLTLPQFLALRSASAAPQKADAVILLWLSGGPSHLDTFDPKPDAPTEIRGQFSPIETNVSGIQLSEHLPLTARVMDKIALVRSLTSQIAAHEQASQYLLTGYRPLPTLQYPSYGSVVARELGSRHSMPPYVGIPDAGRAGQSGFIGAAYNAFEVPDPSAPGFKVQDVNPPARVTDDRIQRRRGFVQRMSDRFAEGYPEDRVKAVDEFYSKAYDLIHSGNAKKAFDVASEAQEVRDRFGMTTLGQGALLARRLVESGARFVTVNKGGWDTHDNNFGRLSGQGGPAAARRNAGP
ncbi:MAG: DUF1501 domain-containing protein, partial [Armatimonadetes bacterium]|nr:DUF1501 domain-containing protein [Armatimonadota bacterium]